MPGERKSMCGFLEAPADLSKPGQFPFLSAAESWADGSEKNVGCHCPPSFSVFPRSPSIKRFDSSAGVRCCLSRRAAFEPPPRLRVAPGFSFAEAKLCSRQSGPQSRRLRVGPAPAGRGPSVGPRKGPCYSPDGSREPHTEPIS
ncbi:hypothetical protein Celaphus_00001450 [Cervus elaphus hippelaphus]|uniref:Uncharacterized protein n=1 Tax=Cervus elaphus hippelaphus TaxID=46360 RepID=A0A212D768_CEREH|nr:hypothetical protein Celaphus_00001450 [Cervus elaphus hippelaphus]